MGGLPEVITSDLINLLDEIKADESHDPRTKAIIVTKLQEAILWANELNTKVFVNVK